MIYPMIDSTKDMNREQIYYLSMVVFGLVVGITSLRDILAEGTSLSRVLALVGGAIVVGATAVEWRRGTEVEPGWLTWLAALGAALVVLGALLSVL